MTSPFIQQIADNRVCQVLTCLPEKFVVDFANGIDVAQEHIRTAGDLVNHAGCRTLTGSYAPSLLCRAPL